MCQCELKHLLEFADMKQEDLILSIYEHFFTCFDRFCCWYIFRNLSPKGWQNLPAHTSEHRVCVCASCLSVCQAILNSMRSTEGYFRLYEAHEGLIPQETAFSSTVFAFVWISCCLCVCEREGGMEGLCLYMVVSVRSLSRYLKHQR